MKTGAFGVDTLTFDLFRPEVISSTPLLVAAAAVVVFFLVDMAGLSSVAASSASSVSYSYSLSKLSVVDAAAKAVRAASLVSLREWVHAKNTKQTYQLKRQRPLALLEEKRQYSCSCHGR